MTYRMLLMNIVAHMSVTTYMRELLETVRQRYGMYARIQCANTL